MRNIFKTRRPRHRAEATHPTPEPAADLGDIMTAYAWQLNLHQWHALTDFERAECRRTVTTAPRFAA